MRIFLSFASEHRRLAEEVYFALTGGGHEVFFDKESLPPADEYHQRIQAAIGLSDLFIFLISRESVAPGAYTLTELRYAREKWPHPKGRVLPVRTDKVPFEEIPNYLKAVTVLEAEGNVPAEVAATVATLQRKGGSWFRPRNVMVIGAAMVFLGLLVASTFINLRRPWSLFSSSPPDSPELSPASTSPTQPACTPEPPQKVQFLDSPAVVIVGEGAYGLLTPKGYIVVPDYVIEYSVQREEPFLRIQLQAKDKNERQEFSARRGRKSGAIGVVCPIGVSLRVRSLDYLELDQLRADATGELFRGPTDRTTGRVIRTSVTSQVAGGRPDNTIEGLVEVSKVSKPGDAGAPFIDDKMRVVGILYAGNGTDQFLPMSTIVKALPEAF
jgi:hypothetical protein